VYGGLHNGTPREAFGALRDVARDALAERRFAKLTSAPAA
jgi:hypothetical protein